MKIQLIVSWTAALTLSASVAGAAHVWEDSGGWWDTHFSYDSSAPKYTAQELSMDLFGSYINPEPKFSHLLQSNIRKGYWGGGVGLNYFLLRNVGLGADVNLSDRPGHMVDQVTGNVILRLPIGESGFSPYVFGGGGRGISPAWEWVEDGGVGLEYRFNPTTGVFADARYIWAEEDTDRLLIRAGIRIVF